MASNNSNSKSKSVTFENVTKIFKEPQTGNNITAVNGVSFKLEPGELVTLLGPSGCGKSTMLRMLSGRVHSVYTGVCVIDERGELHSFADETTVEFNELSDELIAAYVASGEPMDKAGAYGIQGSGALLVKRINGCYYNVMGLPVGRLYHEAGIR